MNNALSGVSDIPNDTVQKKLNTTIGEAGK